MSSPFGQGGPGSGPPRPGDPFPGVGNPFPPAPGPFTGGPTTSSPFPGPAPGNPFAGGPTVVIPPGGGNPFGPSTTGLPADPAPTGPGRLSLVSGLVLAVAATVVAALLGRSIIVAVVAWALAGPVVIGLLAVHTRREARAQAQLFAQGPPAAVRVLYWAVVVAAVAGVGTSAWRMAEWAARL